MELANEYLDKVQKIDGIYVLQISKDTRTEEAVAFHKHWKKLYPTEELIILPDGMDIHKRNRYSFYMAMMLVGIGKRITRFEWAKGKYNLSRAPYLCLESTEEGLEPMLIRKWPNEEDEAEYFFIGKEDMDAEDYMIAPEEEL